MKIFLAFFQGEPNHPISSYSFWPYYIKNGIEEAGHSWIEDKQIDWAYGMVPQSTSSLEKWKSIAWEKALSLIKSERPDFVLSYLYPHLIDSVAIKEIQKLGIPCVNFFCDNVREFIKAPRAFEVFDLNWVPESNALNLYKSAGYKYIHLPMPMWVDPKQREISGKELFEISFIGSRDLQRLLLFNQVFELDTELPLSIYGSGWKETKTSSNSGVAPLSLYNKAFFQAKFIQKEGIKGYIRKLKQRKFNPVITPKLMSHLNGKPSFDDYLSITKHSKITLGVNRYDSYRYPLLKPDSYSRLRDIESPMLGSCYLTEDNSDIDFLYVKGKEIETYSSAEELISKSRDLYENPQKRNELRQAAQIKALNEHSISRSLEKIIQTLL
ncbi:MAG TPA: glycosyltransferase [Pedobacter sp.]|jgi:hypothetical protein